MLFSCNVSSVFVVLSFHPFVCLFFHFISSFLRSCLHSIHFCHVLPFLTLPFSFCFSFIHVFIFLSFCSTMLFSCTVPSIFCRSFLPSFCLSLLLFPFFLPSCLPSIPFYSRPSFSYPSFLLFVYQRKNAKGGTYV